MRVILEIGDKMIDYNKLARALNFNRKRTDLNTLGDVGNSINTELVAHLFEVPGIDRGELTQALIDNPVIWPLEKNPEMHKKRKNSKRAELRCG
jgi:hypothetical protein